jgi:DNA-binding MarR family transcriptional regulator
VKASANRPEAPTPLVATTDVGLWLRLLESQNRILAELRRDLEGVCTIAPFDLLATLDKEDGITLAVLSRRLLVTAGNVTGLVARAERDGLVQRRADKTDRRLSHVHLTPKGRALVASLVPLHGAHLSRLLDGLDGKERRDLHRLLGKLRDSLRAKERR